MAIARDTLVRFLSGQAGGAAHWSADEEIQLLREGMLELACRQGQHKQRSLEAAARELRWRDLLDELDRALAENGARTIVFKGGALLGRLHPIGMRPLSDLDLLAAPQLEPVLLKLGFRHAEGEPWILRRGAFQLDLHQHPLGRHHHAFGWDLRRATQCSLPLTQRQGLYRFTFEDETTIALLHAGKHAYSRWIWLADLHLMLTQCQPGRLAAILKEAGGQRYLLYARWLLAHLANQPPPPINPLERRLLEICLQRRASESLGMLLPLLSIRSPARARRYLWHSLKPQGQDSWRARFHQLWRLARTFKRSASP